jgi:hypothetical protein
MRARWVRALTVGASVLLAAGAARAGEGTGASEDSKELSGKVIKSEANTLYLEHMGAVVPVEIASETRFSGVQSANQLAEGQDVRASFTVQAETRNVAETISLGAPPSDGTRAPPATPTFTDQG